MEISNEAKKQLDNIVGAIDDKMDRKLDEREVSWKKHNLFKSGTSGNSLYNTLKKEKQGLIDVVNKKAISHSFDIDYKAMTIGGMTGQVVGEDNLGLRNIQRDYLNLAGLMSQYDVSPNSGDVRIIVNSSETNEFQGVAEASASVESSLAFTEKKVSLETIRSHFVASQELAESTENLTGFINQRGYQMLTDQLNGQILAGNGSSPNFNGLLNSGNYTSFDYTASNPYYQVVSSPSYWDVIVAGLQILNVDGYNADIVLMNPKQFGELSWVKSTTAEYVQSSNFRIENPFTAVVNGVRVYACSKVPDDQIYWADSGKAFQFCRQGGIRFEATREGKTNFVDNTMIIRLLIRGNVAILNSGATLYADLSDSVTALTKS